MSITRRSILGAALGAGAALTIPGAISALSVTSTTPRVLFVSAHPDDETLMSGVTIAEHVAAGLDVHVLWLSDGEASGVLGILNGTTTAAWWGERHAPAAEGYTALTAAGMAAARVREAANAARALATGLPGRLTFHYAHLADGGVTQSAAQNAILAVCNAINPGAAVRLKGHSWLVEDHPDHFAAGRALKALKAAYPTRFGDVRYYVKPSLWTDSRLSQVSHAWDYPTDSHIKHRAINACRAYGAWSPPHTFAIGMHSVPSMFAPLLTSPKCLYHK